MAIGYHLSESRPKAAPPLTKAMRLGNSNKLDYLQYISIRSGCFYRVYLVEFGILFFKVVEIEWPVSDADGGENSHPRNEVQRPRSFDGKFNQDRVISEPILNCFFLTMWIDVEGDEFRQSAHRENAHRS